MKTHLLQRRQFLPHPLSSVFPFFAVPENLHRITPPSLGFEVLTPSPILMREGAIIEYTIRIMGVRVRWKTRISSYHPPRVFVDEQLSGPYAHWVHTHLFEEADGGTIMLDEVRYALPFGVLGEIVRALFVRRQLQAIFDYREKVIPEFFNETEGGPTKDSVTAEETNS